MLSMMWNLPQNVSAQPPSFCRIPGKIRNQPAPNPPKFAQLRLSRVKAWSSPARGYKFGCETRELEVPRIRLSIFGVNSSTNPETPWKRSQTEVWISKFRMVGDPQPLANKADSLPRFISELCYPQYGWYPFLFWKGPLHGTARAGHEIPNSTGGTSERRLKAFLENLTSLNKEARLFFLSGNSIWSYIPLFLLLAITAFGGPEGDFILAIKAFGGFGFIVPKYCCRLGKTESKESRLLI